MAVTYVPPGVTVQVSGAQSIYSPPAIVGKTILMLGRAPQGPDYPTLCSYSDAVQLFGDPTNTASAGYDLPAALRLAQGQRQPTRNTPVNFLVCRVGVQRAQLNILDGTGNVCFTLQGIGAYAGTKGANLKAAVTQTGSNVSAQQTITITGAPTSMNIVFGFQGAVAPSALAYTAATTNANVLANLITIPTIGTGNVTVAGSAGGPFTVTFASALANTPVPLLTYTTNTIVGGTAPGVAIAQTVAGSAVSIATVTVTDFTVSSTPVQKFQWVSGRDNLLNTVAIANTINGANPLNSPGSVVQAINVSTTAAIPATLANTFLTGGYDGIGAAATDGTIPTLLSQSLWANADYVWAGYDAATIAGVLLTHNTAALAVNQYRKFFLGPKAGTTFASLSTTYLSGASLSNDAFVVFGHDSVYITNPINAFNTAVDGFYGAAAICGIKAVGPTQETAAKFPLVGITGLAIAPDKSALLSPTDLNTLAGTGLTVLEQVPGASGRFQIRDHLTTAAYSINGGVNVFSQVSARDVDHSWSRAMVQGVSPHINRSFASTQALQSAVLTTVQSAAAQLGDTINGSVVAVNLDPSTNAPIVRGSYIMPYPITSVTIPTTFTFS